MSTYKEIKRDFIRDLATSSSQTWKFGDYPEMVDRGEVPVHLFEKWTTRFYKQTPIQLSDKPRLVNHFKLGADPEFAFMSDGRMAYASKLGLRAGLAIGADNNGRLAELRPKPSKFALRVVASMYAEFCFLAQWNPALTKYTWYAQPFVEKDGLGGHIHFGRWAKLRNLEVQALDTLMYLLEKAGCISRTHQKMRLETRLYGRMGDIRPQAHGYEYRTFPTWVSSVRHSHLYLTLAKLAVFDPKLFLRMRHISGALEAEAVLKNILNFYKDQDDDAKIALLYVDQCWRPPTGDIQADWNIRPVFSNPGKPATDILPQSIAPKEAHVRAVFEYLTTGKWSEVNEVFDLLRFPEGYQPFQSVLLTDRRPELGELVWDMARVPMGYKLGNIACHQAPDASLRVSQLLFGMIVSKLPNGMFRTPDRTVCNITIPFGMETIDISFPYWLLKKEHRKWLRKFLTEDGIFPFVRLGQQASPRDWKIRLNEQVLLQA